MAYGSTAPAQQPRSSMRGAVAATSTVLVLVGAVALFQSYSYGEMPPVSGKITQNADLDTTVALAESTAKMSNNVAVDADPETTTAALSDTEKGCRWHDWGCKAREAADRVRREAEARARQAARLRDEAAARIREAAARAARLREEAAARIREEAARILSLRRDCVGDFGMYTDCTKGCGGGTKSRIYTVTMPAQYGGRACPHANGFRETVDCNTGPCTHTGLKRAVWENLNDKADDWRNENDRLVHVLPGALAEGTAPTKPDTTPSSECGLQDSFEAPVDTIHDGGQLIAGVFIPPTSGSYEFSLAADDGGELYFGKTVASKTKIASVTSFLGAPGKYNGESTQASTEVYFTDAKRETGAVSAPIELTAGTKYYISAMEINRQGRDALSVAAKGGPFSSEMPIPATYDGKTVLSYEAKHESALAACSIEDDPTPAIATTFEYPK